MGLSESNNVGTTFKKIGLADVPHGRNGKHKAIVTRILIELSVLKIESALKVPLAGLLDSGENVRSALNRAARKSGRKIATVIDTDFLYVWNESGKQ